MFRIILGIFIFFFSSFALAIDVKELGDFSSRSVLLTNKDKQKPKQELITILASKKLYPNTQCLINEIDKGNIENVSLLLKTNMDINQSYYGEYPIYHAAKKNNFEIVKLLFENGAKLDRGFYSELYEAVRNKNTQMAQFLIDNNAKVNYTDYLTNNTILSLSLKNDMNDITKQLIQKGALIDTKSAVFIKKKKINLEEFTNTSK